ncbi:uncharacterized protein LOC144664667 isoform X3 [Oculina patagonica]
MSRPFPALSLLFVTVLWGGWLHCSTVADCHRRPIRTKLKVATARDSEGLCRRLYFVIKIDGHALQGHVFKNLSLRVVPEMRRVCTHECLMEPVCVSMNIGPPIQDEFVCELSNSDHLLHPNDLKQREGFMYLGTENPCYSNPCLHNATCLNGFTDKGYLCECQAGYTGEQCENDIDECAMKMDNCSENAMCNNTEGSFNCSCKPGFSGDGINCADIDECTMKIHNCSENAMCNNTEGSFNCSCKPGFSGDGINCTDLDECTMKIHNCSENAMCNNTEGSFNCSCKPGFSGDGINCTDIDECTIKIHNCSENAMCNNTEGSFNCSCKPGFSGDGINCTDIDECAMGIHNCSLVTICNNIEGSFNCTCKDRFHGNGNNLTAFSAVFTNLGASGRNGSTSLGSHYTGQDHDGQVTLSSGIQQWTVPYSGEYRIEAVGAAGGYDTGGNSPQYRGRGARMIGTFSLCKGEIIQILVGQEGGINSHKYSSGGGGGTFVVRGINTPLIIAGGGGGIQRAYSRHAGCDANTSTTGNPGYKSWSGGSYGHGAQVADSSNSGGGGGGFYSSGRSGTNFNGTMGWGGEGGEGFLQGGVGGRAVYYNANGGFGGGGGGDGWGGGGGGGGGYSGGSSGNDGSDTCAGGGGSYNVGENQGKDCCYNTAGHGNVTIVFLQ